MWNRWKTAEDVASAAVSPLPQVAISPKQAPGLKGPKGLSPKTNYSRVNTGSPPSSDAGAEAQKTSPPLGATMLPKVAGEASMTTMAVRPTLQQMVKSAMAEGARNVGIRAEALRQSAMQKTAEDTCPKCKKSMGECKCEKAKEGSVSSEYALKLASAIEYGVDALMKQATDKAKIGPGMGPGALSVSKSVPEKTISHDFGQATPKNQPPMRPGEEKAPGAGKLETNLAKRPGGSEKMLSKNSAPVELMQSMLSGQAAEGTPAVTENQPVEAVDPAIEAEAAAADATTQPPVVARKTASTTFDNLVDYLLHGQKKEAEDAINPAKIKGSKGDKSALPTSAAEQPGGAPVGGMPKGPRKLVHSIEAAINFKPRDAYANRKEDLRKYVDEPPLSAKTDKTLQQAFENTGRAGTKISSATPEDATKVAAARALISKLAEEAEARSK